MEQGEREGILVCGWLMFGFGMMMMMMMWDMGSYSVSLGVGAVKAVWVYIRHSMGEEFL